MNKQKFVEYLRSPENLSANQFQEIEQLLVDYPYFSIAKSVAARASKKLDTPNKNQLISSAAIYATDRKHLKKYVNGEVIFLTDTPSIAVSEEQVSSKTSKETAASSSPKEEAQKPSSLPEEMKAANSDVDQILDELHRDMEELKKSRLHFAEVQSLLPEGSEIPRPPYKAKEKSQTIEEKSEVTKNVISETEDNKKESTIKEEKTEETTNTGNITSLIDSLKKEFEEEEEGEKASAAKKTIPEGETQKVEDQFPTPPPLKEEEPIKAKAKVEEKEEKPEDTQKPEPPKKTKPAVVTNMDDGDDEDEEDTVLDPNDKPVGEAPSKKTSARASRGSRQKVKREDLERMMGIMSKPSGKQEEPKADTKKEIEKEHTANAAPEVQSELKKAVPEVEKEEKKTEKKVSKKTTTKKKKEGGKETKPKVKKTTKKKEEKKTEEPKAGVDATSENKKESELSEKQDDTPSSPISKSPEEEPTRTSARAFLDFGGTGDMSASVSRASSSRRKRKRSTNSSSDSGEKKGGDDDDKSGPKDLIDKFIEDNPSIQRRNLGSDKKDLSEESSQWKSDIASEYLAEIYLNQGNKQRAVQIYEALILKFPEKKSYFAALIEKVQG